MSAAGYIYEGTVRHWRAHPERAFSHRLALAYLDPAALPGAIGGDSTSRRPRLVRFRRADYLGNPGVPLDTAVRDTVEERTGIRPTGRVRVLTQLRSFGHCFNPVSFYYCLDHSGEELQALVAEVTNTPWGERHAYVLSGPGTSSSRLEGRVAKALHVSPFMGMDHTYTCRASVPGETICVTLETRRGGESVFAATLALRRRELTRSSLAGAAARYPAATVRVLALIYAEAIKLRFAGAPTFAHPRTGDG